MNIENSAIAQKLKAVRQAMEQSEAIDIGGSKAQLKEALAAQQRLRDVIDSLIQVRDETERNISAIRRVLSLLDEPRAMTSTEEPELTPLADLHVWQQAEIALRKGGQYMTPADIASAIRALGGDPGKQSTAGISNGAKTHQDIFHRKGESGSYVFGLREWEDRTDMQPMFEG
jgi:hypothetical protein